MKKLLLSLGVCALVLGHVGPPALAAAKGAAAKPADKTRLPPGKDAAFRKGPCKPQAVQGSSDGGKTWLNKGECATWGLDEDAIGQVHAAKTFCSIYVDYNVAMDDIPTLDCEARE